MRSERLRQLAAAVALVTMAATSTAHAESILGALAKAYQNNADLNAARAGVRATDEGVAIAKSGYRPTVTGTFDYALVDSSTVGTFRTGSFGITINQALFDGFQTRNSVGAAEAQVMASRENLRNTGQNILFDAAAAYMDVIQFRQIASLREQNLAFLDEQVRAAQARFDVGEGTRTDVAQARAQRSAAIAQLNAARADARSAEAVYRQIVGEDPGRLEGAAPFTRAMPRSLEAAYVASAANHPAIKAQKHLVDASVFRVKVSEGALLPTVGLSASVERDLNSRTGDSNVASLGARVTVPIYQGGRAAATVRQNKETLSQARIQVDAARDNVRAAVASAWTGFEAAKASVAAQRETVDAARLALSGVIEERNVGQRTTLDVLNAQADVLSAQILLAQAQRNVVVASYAVLSAVGRLSPSTLGLRVAEYQPEEHFEAVKDKWYGLRTPDGR